MSIVPGKCYLISAGELSGDLLAADLVHALRGIAGDLTPFGIAGESMLRAGVLPITPMSDLAVMGVIEIARRLVDIRMIEQRLIAWVDRFNPAFAVLVDFPGFHFKLAEQLHLRGIPVYQYVAPKVWAWGKSRVHLLREHFTGVIGILPFEEDFFLRHGVRYRYVGSPHLDRMNKLDVQTIQKKLPPSKKIIAFLPGSRMTELRGILPVMIAVRKEIQRREPDTLCVIPLAQGLLWEDVAPIVGAADSDGDQAQESAGGWSAGGFWWIRGWSLELMKIANSAVVASGTATLECALAGTPMVVVYVMNELSFAIARRMVDLKWVSLVNLLMNQEIVTEYLQHINPIEVADEVLALSTASPQREKMVRFLDDLSNRLVPGAAHAAARWIVQDHFNRNLRR